MHTPGTENLQPTARPRRRGRGLALVAFACALGPGCRVAGAHLHNLDELHEPTGRHAVRGDLVSPLGYHLRVGSRGLFGEGGGLLGGGLLSGQEERFDDPLKLCLRNAARLAALEPTDERFASAQLATLAWLAVEDPWNLTRETCMRALGSRGARLGAEVPPPRDEEPAGPEEVRAALARVVDAVRSPGPGASAELEAACAGVELLELDRAAALRLARGLGKLKGALSTGDPRAPRLARALRFAERALVAETLLAGLADEPPREVGGSQPGWNNPRVRAAAVEACVEAFGDQALGELVQQLDREYAAPVVQAILSEVARRGLPPAPEGFTPEQGERVREGWIMRILAHAYDHPSGSVRVAAMRALSRIRGGRSTSLREGDWFAWALARETGPGPESAASAAGSARP